jgi:hypothetical protein
VLWCWLSTHEPERISCNAHTLALLPGSASCCIKCCVCLLVASISGCTSCFSPSLPCCVLLLWVILASLALARGFVGTLLVVCSCTAIALLLGRQRHRAGRGGRLQGAAITEMREDGRGAIADWLSPMKPMEYPIAAIGGAARCVHKGA